MVAPKNDFYDTSTPGSNDVAAAWLNLVATMVAAAYVKSGTGIPVTDFAAAVQTSLGKADTAYQKPVNGITSADFAAAVVASLGKADSALQSLDSDLVAIAALAPGADDFIQRKAGAWTNRSVAQAKTDLGVATDIAAAQLEGTVNTQAANYTLVLADAGRPVHFTKATTGTVTIPSGVFSVGQSNRIVQAGAGQMTVVQGSGATLVTADTLLTRKQWSPVTWHCYATNTFLLMGDMQ